MPRKASFDPSRSRGELEVEIAAASHAERSLYRIYVVRQEDPVPGGLAALRFKKIDMGEGAPKSASVGAAPKGLASRRSMGVGERFLKVLFAFYFADDVGEIIDAMLECVCESVGVEMAAICLLDESAENLIVEAVCGLDLPTRRIAIPLSDLVKKPLFSRKDLFEHTFFIDSRSGFPYAHELERAGIGSVAIAPLVGDEGTIGFCALLSPSKKKFSGREISIIRSFGERLGVALRSKASGTKRFAKGDLLAGANIAAAVIGANDLRILSANSVFKSLFGIDAGESAKNAATAFEDLDLAGGVAEVADTAGTKTFLGCKCASGAWVNTYWNAFLAVDKFAPSRRVSTVAFLAVDVTPEVEAERRAERYAAQLASVQRMGITLSGESDLQSLLDKMAAAAVELVDAENCAIALCIDGEWVWVALHAKDENRRLWSKSAVWRSIKQSSACIELLNRRTTARLTALSGGSSAHPPRSRSEPTALLAVPVLERGGEVIGQILLGGKNGCASFGEADEGAMVVFAAQAASLIKRVRELERERGTVEILSEALTPKVPAIEGVDVDVAYRPSGKAGVCGDFLDFIEFEDGKIGLVVGDVCGRGVEAATAAVMARHVIRTYAYEKANPSKVLERANAVIKDQLPLGRFVTAFYGVLDAKTGLLRYSSAGHPPPFAFNRSAVGVRFFDCGSIPLGILDGVQYTESSLKLAPDEVLVLYTDGLSEARRGPVFFGEERMLEVVGKFGANWKRFAQSLVDEAIRFAGGIEDDIAVVALSLSRG